MSRTRKGPRRHDSLRPDVAQYKLARQAPADTSPEPHIYPEEIEAIACAAGEPCAMCSYLSLEIV